MSEEQNVEEVESADFEETENVVKNDEKVICYLSKKTVSMSDTVEVKYNDTGVYRVRAELVKF